MESPGQNIGVSSLSLLQAIFPTQGLNPGLPHCGWIFLPAEPQGKPKNTGVDSLPLLQGIFLTQGLNPGLPHCRRILHQLSHKGSPRIREWTAYPFSRGSSWPRDWTQVSLIAGRFFTSWATREAQEYWSGQLIPSPGDLPDPEITRGLLHSLPSEPSGSPTWSRLSIKILNKNKLVTRRDVTPGCHSSLLLLFDTAPHSERRRMERMKCCAHLVQCSVVWTVPSLHPWRDQSHRSWCEGSCTSSEQHAI